MVIVAPLAPPLPHTGMSNGCDVTSTSIAPPAWGVSAWKWIWVSAGIPPVACSAQPSSSTDVTWPSAGAVGFPDACAAFHSAVSAPSWLLWIVTPVPYWMAFVPEYPRLSAVLSVAGTDSGLPNVIVAAWPAAGRAAPQASASAPTAVARAPRRVRRELKWGKGNARRAVRVDGNSDSGRWGAAAP